MSLSLTVPKDYGYVLGVATFSTLLATWHALNTSRFRTKAKVTYPNAYCTHAEAEQDKEKYLFNCAQRAHANYQEHQPQMLVGLLVGGLRYPVLSASMGVAWCVARIAFTLGYTRRDQVNGRGRRFGAMTAPLIEMSMIIMSGITGYKMIME